MKKLLLLLLSAVVFSACASEEKNSDDCALPPGDGEESIVGCELPDFVDPDAEVVDPSVLPPEVPTVNATEVRDYLFTASSTLVDDTNIGFNYEPAMVSDMDFSTAWCRASGDTEPSIVFDFSRSVKAEKFGIVPGFGRDEKIYFQNNRLKKVTLFFDDKNPMEVELKDDYGMQFVALDGKEFSNIKLVVNDVYKGSKYDDTCVSEWDFSSDYVQKGDSVAAMDFYVKEKKANALRPYDIVGKIVLSMDEPDKCANPMRDYADPASAEVGYAVLWNLPIYLSAYINEFGREGDKVEVRWYTEKLQYSEATLDVKHLGYVLEEVQKDVPVVKACDGKLYAHTSIDELSNANYMWASKDKVEIYFNGKFVGMEFFDLNQ